MKNIYEAATLQELTQRIDTLKPDSQRQWGKMDVAQMLAHCCAPIEVALGDKTVKTTLMGKLIGPLIKGVITNEKPFKQSSPTDPSFIIKDPRNFEQEKGKLKGLLTRLTNGGPQGMENKRHPFFGKMTPQEWSNSHYKHMDHHLRQFGV